MTTWILVLTIFTARNGLNMATIHGFGTRDACARAGMELAAASELAHGPTPVIACIQAK